MNVLENLINNLVLSKDVHLGVCFEALNTFSALCDQEQAKLHGAGPSRSKKASRVSFSGNLQSASNKRLSALSDLSFDSITNVTFTSSSVIKRSTASEAATGCLNRSVVKSEGQPVVKFESDRQSPCLNKTITKSSRRAEESKRQIMTKTVTKSKKVLPRDSMIANETIVGSPLKKIARPSIQPLIEDTGRSASNQTNTQRVLSDSDDSPPVSPKRSTTSHNQTLKKSKSDSILIRNKKESKPKVARTSKKSDMNATFTLDSTTISKQAGADRCMTNSNPANVTALLDSHSVPLNVTVTVGSQNSLKRKALSNSCLTTLIPRSSSQATGTSRDQTLAKSKSGSALTKKESKPKVARTSKKSVMNATFSLDSTTISKQDGAGGCMTYGDPMNVTVLGNQNSLKSKALSNSYLTTPIAHSAPLPTGTTPYCLRPRSERKSYKY